MPIYEYECHACGHALEAFQKMSEAPLSACPACGKDTLQKLVSAAGFQLKGTGWYATDFKNKGKEKTETKSSTSTEVKTDNKTSESAPIKSSDSGSTSSTETKKGG